MCCSAEFWTTKMGSTGTCSPVAAVQFEAATIFAVNQGSALLHFQLLSMDDLGLRVVAQMKLAGYDSEQ